MAFILLLLILFNLSTFFGAFITGAGNNITISMYKLGNFRYANQLSNDEEPECSVAVLQGDVQ